MRGRGVKWERKEDLPARAVKTKGEQSEIEREGGGEKLAGCKQGLYSGYSRRITCRLTNPRSLVGIDLQ